MKLKEEIKDLSHHAYCLIGFSPLDVIDFLEKSHNIKTKGNPDFFSMEYPSFTIDESRKIKELHTLKPFTENGKRIFIIGIKSITHEAQNSLLKILEESNVGTHFFILSHSAEYFLPTLRSRLFIIKNDEEIDDEEYKIDEFLKMPIGKKIEFVDKIAKDISDEKNDKSYAIGFLKALEKKVREKGIEDNARVLKSIIKALDYITDRSPSIKQLLEFVALSL